MAGNDRISLPTQHRAGATAKWEWAVDGFSSADSWDSSLMFNDGAGNRFTLTGSAAGSGSGWEYDGLPATTAAWVAAEYGVTIQVSKAAEIFQPVVFSMRILQDYDAANAALVQLQTDLTTTETTIREAVAASDGLRSYQIQTSVSTRSYEWMDLAELRRHRSWLVEQIDKVKANLGIIPHRKTGWRRIVSKVS